MSSSQSKQPRPYSPSDRRNEVCLDFRTQWLDHKQPRLEEYLTRLENEDPDTFFRELLTVEFNVQRINFQKNIDLVSYYTRFPDKSNIINDVFETVTASSLGPGTTVPMPQADSHAEPKLIPADANDNTAMTGRDTPALVNKSSGRTTLPDVPGYKLLSVLGRGGMGVVYKARHEKLNRVVALKMIHANIPGDEIGLTRFHGEAEAVAALQHPHIVQIYEIGEINELPFMALEFVAGGTLAERLAKGTMSHAEMARLIQKLAQAMAAAHHAGIIHRDLKPANILLTKSGEPKITDFGLAKRVEGDSHLTQTGMVMGTPSYMAPEQAQGDTTRLGPATDVYALGAILYECLTKRPPFLAKTPVDTVVQVVHKDPVPPSKRKRNVPRDLETICLKCLAKQTDQRYSDANALADDLQRYLDGDAIRARRASFVERGWRWLRRRRAEVVVVVSCFIVLAMALITAHNLWRGNPAATPPRAKAEVDPPFALQIPEGLPPVGLPSDNLMTVGKVKLGRQLFFDPRLSSSGNVSCATCHDPKQGWSNGQAVAVGVNGKVGTRSAPTLINVAYQHFLFWDGRASSLERQTLQPIQNPLEMNMPLADLEQRLNRIDEYKNQFRQVFGTDVTAVNAAKAIAAFERTILAGGAPIDQYRAGNHSALSAAAKRGWQLFNGKAKCAACHSGPQFTDDGFHNIGIGVGSKDFDVGREKVTGLLGDRGSFKTPTLREITRTSPYMHDGSIKTLEEVVAYYNRGGNTNHQLDEEIHPLKLTEAEQRDVVIFLREGLASRAYPEIEAPQLPE